MKYQRTTTQPENPFASLIPHQTIACVPSFELESGVILYNVPVAYSIRGTLSPQGDNAMVICHALSGSSDVSDWWGPLLGGPGKAFDVTRFFIVCMNSLGSPYGTASPVTARDGDPSLGNYGPEFPLTTIRDDVRLCKVLLDDLGVKQVAAVVGGSMGGMLALEFAYFGKDYVRCIIPIATSARHSAWGISWGEAQRQSIYSDPKYEDGYYAYDDPPTAGLGAARMAALLTYRSRDSFESRFGRNILDPSRRQTINAQLPRQPRTSSQHFDIHNEGHRRVGLPRLSTGRNSPTTSVPGSPREPQGTAEHSPPASAAGMPNQHQNQHYIRRPDQAPMDDTATITDPQFHGATPLRALSSSPPTTSSPTTPQRPRTPLTGAGKPTPTTYFSAQSYLRYQGEKFIKRFDANCYIAITRKLDTHDVSYHSYDDPSSSATASSTSAAAHLKHALSLITQPTLVLGIESDGLFTFAEQQEIAAGIPGARLERIESAEGHDAFLLQFEQVNRYALGFLREVLGDLFERNPVPEGNGVHGGADVVDGARGEEGRQEETGLAEGLGGGGTGTGTGTATKAAEKGFGKVLKNSVFGEAEVDDITAW